MFTYHSKFIGTAQDDAQIERFVQRKRVRVLPLRYQKNCALIYLYRPSKLSKDLENDVARTILTECGYCINSPKVYSKFNARLNSCEDFPHEIGLFLGTLRKMFWGLFKIKPAVTNM